MLAELNVENVALIEKSRLSLGPGFNVLTGETGAGKSLVLDALGMVIGQRAGADLIRTGAQAARVEALFEVPASSGVAQALEAAGYPPEDGQLLLAREIHRSGRNRCRINGRPATVGELARLGALLVDVQTQHESQRLMLASVQLQLLDAFAGPEVLELAGRVADLWGRWSAARSELEQLRTRERERLHEIDLLRFQIQEIDAAALRPGEEEALMDEHSRLAHAVQLQQLLGEALEHLGAGASSRADVGALALSGMAQRLVQQAASLDRALEPIGRELLACTEQLGELARDAPPPGSVRGQARPPPRGSRTPGADRPAQAQVRQLRPGGAGVRGRRPAQARGSGERGQPRRAAAGGGRGTRDALRASGRRTQPAPPGGGGEAVASGRARARGARHAPGALRGGGRA
ncbi:MAG: AAA family ATPase [Limnochordaceae bacterium]|nr:AAA family ATPase [Limnochordaceae bacterium]